MSTHRLQLDANTLACLQGLELRARHIVDGHLTGIHRGAHRGQSVEFAEHREYTPGDDLRYVDWKVFGKTDKAYLKQFRAETNLDCYVLLDVSQSMDYRHDPTGMSKLEYAQCLTVAMAHLVLQQRDRVGLVTFDEQIRDFIRASGNAATLGQLVEVMQQATATGASAHGQVLHEFSQRVPRRGLVMLFSDLLGDVDRLLLGLKHLRYSQHEVLVVQLLDRAEVEFPFRRATCFQGLESLPDVVVEPRSIRQAYLAALKTFCRRVEVGCRSLQIDYCFAQTKEPLDVVVRRALLQISQRGQTC